MRRAPNQLLAAAMLAALLLSGCGSDSPAKATAPASVTRATTGANDIAYVRSFTKTQRDALGGEEPCDIADDTARIRADGVARTDKVTEGYQAQLKAGCRTVPGCRYDNDAFWKTPYRPAYAAHDLNHYSIKGHAKAAAVAWRALRQVGLLPG